MQNAKYTWDDIIINPEDPRLEIGAEYYFSSQPVSCIEYANTDNNEFLARLENINSDKVFPFDMSKGEKWLCLIRKKELEKKYVPFDLSRPEVRENLMMKKIINKDGFSEEVIWRFMNVLSDAKANTREWIINNSIHESDLFKHWTFSDSSPCGELVGITSDDGLSEAENDN